MARIADVRFHPEAIAEFDAAVDWYRERSEQAAEAFVAEVEHAIVKIAEHPSIWTEYLHGTRKYLLRRFPYLLIYVFYETKVQVVAVAHGSRRPGYWKARLKAR